MDVIETERLVLRHQTEDDAPFVLGLMNDPGWLRHIGDRKIRTVADARVYIRDDAVAMYAQHGVGLYLVETKVGRVPVGVCGLLRRAAFDDVDLGFALTREHRGLGYAREAATATVAHGRDVLGLDRIAAIVSPGNAASIRLLEGLGFRFERTVKPEDGGVVQLFALEL